MKQFFVMMITVLFCVSAFAQIDPLARAKSQLGWAEGLMDGIKNNPSYDATKDRYRQITEHLTYAKEFLDKADGGDEPEEKAKLTEWYDKLVKEWEALKKKYYKDMP